MQNFLNLKYIYYIKDIVYKLGYCYQPKYFNRKYIKNITKYQIYSFENIKSTFI